MIMNFAPTTYFWSKPAIIGFWLLKDNNGIFCIQTNLIELADLKNDHDFLPHPRISGQKRKLSVFRYL